MKTPIVEQRGLKFAPTITDRAEEFHTDNPWVLEELARLAIELKNDGYERWSVDGLLHTIRFASRRRINRDGSGFRINNSFSSFYARKLMQEYPELQGFFELRVRRVA